MIINDPEIAQKIGFKLGIYGTREFSREELLRVSNILISNIDFRGNTLKTNLAELVELSNLKVLALKGFDLDMQCSRILASLKELETLMLYSCFSQSVVRIEGDKLKNLIFDRCRMVTYKGVVCPENLSIIGADVDLSDIEDVTRVKDLELKLCNVANADQLSRFTSLEKAVFDGTIFDNKRALEKLPKRILVSHEEDCHEIE